MGEVHQPDPGPVCPGAECGHPFIGSAGREAIGYEGEWNEKLLSKLTTRLDRMHDETGREAVGIAVLAHG